MTKRERVQYQMFLRVRDFGATHSGRFPESSTGGQLFATVARATAQIEAQSSARFKAGSEGRHGKVARLAMWEWMRDIARTSRGVSRQDASRRTALRVPLKANDEVLLAAARVFLEQGTLVSDTFVQLGLDANWHDAFKATIDTFEASLKDRRSGRYGVSAAHASIKASLAEGFDALHTLDVVVANSLKGDPALMPAWLRGRRVVDTRGNDVTTEAARPDVSSSNTAPAVPPAASDDELKKAS